MGFTTMSILTLVIGLACGTGLTFAGFIINNKRKISNVKKTLEEIKKEADRYKRDSILELKEESYKLKKQTEEEIKERKKDMISFEEKILQREKSLDKREETLQNRDNLLNEKDDSLNKLQKHIQEKESKIDNLLKEEMKKLENIAKFSKEKAHDLIMQRVEDEMSLEIAEYIQEKEAEAKLSAQDTAKSMITSAMQRYASDVASEQTVSVIELPNDEMKGRLIGREGRNIRTIEAVTGVDLIIDDTPEAIVISSFDPLRREIAKITIETLIKDGRIHPSRIEEVYDKVSKDMNEKITQIGNDAILELGLTKFDPKLVHLVGRLHFRTSYGQNALTHSMEVAKLCGILAGELNENIMIAKRAGLLHDIGKAIDFELEGSHVEIGLEIAKKYKENEIVCNAIASHHGDVDANNIISVLVNIADTLSASRPGARNDSLENYIQRLEKLEELSSSFAGVEKTYAMQAGREVRVIVKPDEIDDTKSFKLARDIKEKIESELQYPGTIKITVIRETRVEEQAK